MATAILAAFARSPRRLRLTFDAALGSGAFSTSWFTVVAVDAWGVTVATVEAFVVASRSVDVELALDHDLSPGAHYRVDVAAGIPGGGVEPSPASSAGFVLGVPLLQADPERDHDEITDAIFRRDVAHSGADVVESQTGDLESVNGVENGRAAVRRRAAAQGLRWDSSYGPGIRQFVDAPVFGLYAMRGQIAENLRQDDRVRTANVVIGEATVDGADVTVPIDVEFVGGALSRIEVTNA